MSQALPISLYEVFDSMQALKPSFIIEAAEAELKSREEVLAGMKRLSLLIQSEKQKRKNADQESSQDHSSQELHKKSEEIVTENTDKYVICEFLTTRQVRVKPLIGEALEAYRRVKRSNGP